MDPGDERLEAAIERLTDSERFAEAERGVSRAAPPLQSVLASALAHGRLVRAAPRGGGGWFGETQRGEALRVATLPDPDERVAAVGTLLAEEARMAMMVGVAV